MSVHLYGGYRYSSYELYSHFGGHSREQYETIWIILVSFIFIRF